MRTRARRGGLLGWAATLSLSIFAAGCTVETPIPSLDAHYPEGGLPWIDGGYDAGPPIDAYRPPVDAGPLNPDAACASAVVEAEVERLPVDIIWLVDNSSSMRPAIEQVQAGLGDFADLIGARDLDYRVIMLSLRGRGETSIGGGTVYQVCIPQPLAGDDECGDGPRFFHVSVNIKSTQPLEQFLGTLGQSFGYRADASEQTGSEPWAHLLRPEATKTIVVVSDDNTRMRERTGSGFRAASSSQCCEGDPEATADWFESREAGGNEFNTTRDLPEGILHPRWGGLFDGYTFSGIYGWGSESDPLVACTYPDGTTEPDAPGPTYSALVTRTGGVRAQLCDGASAWGPFFDAVATAVSERSRIDCAIPIPPAPDGEFFARDRINVFLTEGDVSTRVGKVADASACDGTLGGWYYDDEDEPTEVVLCPVSCESAQPTAGEGTGVDVQFGCQTLPI